MRRLLKVTAMTGLLTLLRMAMGFVIAKVVAVYTGPTGMAMLGQVQSMVVSLNGMINAPVGSGIVRFTAEKHERGFDACAPWWRASLEWVLLISLIAIPLGLLQANNLAIWLLHDQKLAWVVIAAVCILPFTAIGTLFTSLINGQQQYRRYVVLGMVSTLVSSGLMLVMIVQANIQGALLAATLQSGLIGVVMLLASLRQPWFKLHYWWGNTDRSARKAIGGYMLMAITTALTVPISLILVRNILIDQVGWIAAGQWQAVWRISEAYLGVITMALSTYYLPKLSSLKSPLEINAEIMRTFRIVMPLVVCLSTLVYILRDLIISILFTGEFAESRDLFAIQLCGDVLKIASWLYAFPMLSRGATRWYIFSELFFSISFVILSYLFVLHFGVKGVTMAYCLNYFLYFTFVFFNVGKFST
jgi:O-antigen/teichoic acid export membrane protein